MVKLIPNNLNTYSPYNLPVLAKLKNNNLPYYIVYRDFNDKFIEASGEQYTWWEPNEIDSWMSLDDLTKLWKVDIPKKVSNVIKYKELMKRYRDGEFGSTPLTLAEILKASNEYSLLEDMSCEEVEELLKESTGMTKMIFSHILELKKQGLYK